MKSNSSLKKVQLALIIALLLCLLPMPYGYYTLIRVFVLVYFGYLAFTTNRKSRNSTNLFAFYIIVMLVFQPFIRLPLGRELWNMLDIGLAIWILLNLGKRK